MPVNEDTEDREKLVRLRVGIARLAQAKGLETAIPNNVEGERAIPFERLCRLAEEQEDGWHRLLALILDS